jgi:probable rRNA maturation factor
MVSVRVTFTARAGNIGAALFRSCALAALAGERKTTADLSYVIIDDGAMHEMNRNFLGHDYPTDIITFSLGEGKAIEGEMYISVDTARTNAASYGVSLREELARLAVHGVLHLCGYGDATEAEQAEMRKKENRYLAAALAPARN